MADIELVIRISQEDFAIMKHNIAVNNPLCPLSQEEVVFKIANGTPLPKGHGRLIDADAFIAMMEDASKRQKYKELLIDDCLTVDDVFKAIIESLLNKGLAEGDAPTIIKAESEDKE
jgi:hypothetical protein